MTPMAVCAQVNRRVGGRQGHGRERAQEVTPARRAVEDPKTKGRVPVARVLADDGVLRLIHGHVTDMNVNVAVLMGRLVLMGVTVHDDEAALGQGAKAHEDQQRADDELRRAGERVQVHPLPQDLPDEAQGQDAEAVAQAPGGAHGEGPAAIGDGEGEDRREVIRAGEHMHRAGGDGAER